MRYSVGLLRVVLFYCIIAGFAASGNYVSSAELEPASSSKLQIPPPGKWGYPPNDAPERRPELPPYQGWCRFMSATESMDIVAANDELLIILVGNDLVALRLDSGEELWKFRLNSKNPFVEDFIFGGDTCYTIDWTGKDHLVALDVVSGNELWRREEVVPISAGDGYVWAASQHQYRGGIGNAWVKTLYQLDSRTGEEIRSHEFLKKMYAVGSSSPDDDWLVLATEGALHMIFADGTVKELPRPLPKWDARICASRSGFALCEYASDFDMVAGNAYKFTSGNLEKLHHSQPSIYGANTLISFYSSEDFELKWQRGITVNEITARYLDSPIFGPFCFDNYLADPRPEDGLQVWNLETGDVALDWGNVEEEGSVNRFFIKDHQILFYESFYDDREKSQWIQVDLALGKSSAKPVALTSEPWFWPYKLAGSKLLYNPLSRSWHEPFGRNTNLFALDVDENLLPIPGEMKAVDMPDDFNELVQRFYAIPEPLQNDLLMGEVISNGINAIFRLLEAAEPTDTAQLDALIAACGYIESLNEERQYRGGFIDVMIHTLKTKADQTLAAQVVSWLENDGLELFHHDFKAVLAMCGGNDAAAYLERQPISFPGLHEQMEPPYEVEPQETNYTDLEGNDHVRIDWAEVIADDQTRLVAFTANGLVSARQIYIGVDINNDGGFEEILPTGLTDIFQEYRYHRVEAKKLQMQMINGQLKIHHNVPIILKDEEYGYEYFDETDFKETTLTLEQLRLDTDGDGLTDITESLLLLDPTNPDTDGDGISDLQDPTPNVNISSMGRVERGIARALIYFSRDQHSGDGVDWVDPSETGHPWQAMYFKVDGAGSVAIAGNQHTFGISLSNELDSKKLADHLNSYPSLRLASLRWSDATLPPLELLRSDPYYDNIENPSQEQLDEFMESYTVYMSTDFQLQLDFPGEGYAVDLVEVNGEYYPCKAYWTWNS